MENDELKRQIERWIARKTSPSCVSRIVGLPITLATDVGSVRVENQDRVALVRFQRDSNNSILIGVLCDGMGGMVDGKTCAELVTSTFIASCVNNSCSDLKIILTEAAHVANDSIFNIYQGASGTTLSAFIIDNTGNIEAINVGDSRIYITWNEVLKQLTTDDTIAGQLKNSIETNEASHQLLQYIGMGDELEPHSLDIPSLNSMSKIVITSDGTHYISRETFRQIVTSNISSKETAKRLIKIAKWCGGHDNASALVVNVNDLVSLNPSNDKVSAGLIEIWDSFGEIQFVHKSNFNFQGNKLIENTQNSVPDVGSISSKDKSKPTVNMNEKKNKNSNRGSKLKRKGSSELEEQPNLRIDFE